MQQNQLDRILRLVRRTGDRFVVADSVSDEVFAVMRLDEYEHLLDNGEPVENLTEKEMFSKVNHDIASWRARHQSEIESLFDEDDDEEIYEEVDETFDPDFHRDDNSVQNDKKFQEEKKIIEDDDLDIAPPSLSVDDVDIPTEIDVVKKNVNLEPQIIPLPTLQTEQSIPAPASEVSLHDVPEDEEEKFYLEPVE